MTASAATHSFRCDAVLFDCDGVLVDSEPLANRVLSRILAEHGVSMTPEECRAAFVGLNPRGVARRLIEIRGVDLTEVMVTQAVPRFMRALESEGLSLVPGVLDVLAWLRRTGLPFAVASNSPIDELLFKLRLTGLHDLFAPRIHSGDQLGHAKPEPHVYLAAAAGLGLDPARCIVVEDTVTGVKAGVRAGATVFGFDGAHGAPGHHASLTDAGAALVFSSMSELPGLLDDSSGHTAGAKRRHT